MTWWQKYKLIIGKSFFLLTGCLSGFLLWHRFAQIPKHTSAQAFLHMWEWYTIAIVFGILSLALLYDEDS